VITEEHWLIVTYVPKELLRAGALIKSRIVDEINSASLSSGHTDLEVGSLGCLDVAKLFVHGLQERYEVCLVCGFVKAVIGSCIYHLILLSVLIDPKRKRCDRLSQPVCPIAGSIHQHFVYHLEISTM
jgi:hypothetical protein